MNNRLTFLRIQKYLNEAYAIFEHFYRYCEITDQNIYLNGINEIGELDTYGHYLKVNGCLYAINIGKSIEDFGFNNYLNKENEIGVEIIKFKGDVYADDEIRYRIVFQTSTGTPEFIELYDMKVFLQGKEYTTDWYLISKITPKKIEIESFEYISPGFHLEM